MATYLCIDLKSFYASVECVERGLDPMTTDLVVADLSRTEKTICLAVSPSLKAKGVPGRCRVFEIPKSFNYIAAKPRMKLYIEYSANIYGIYLQYFSKEDIHVYSIDEVFIDVTQYLSYYHLDAQALAVKLLRQVRDTYGITATCGIGSNLYLCKIAMDITAKHMDPGQFGERIGILDEESYQKTLWSHEPITDFWRVGKGIAGRLSRMGIFTMGQLAHAPEDLLYKVFGIDAELLIDHAWGRESTTMADIKAYRPSSSGLSVSQVLPKAYSFEQGELIVKEMADNFASMLMKKGLVTQNVSLLVGYEKQLDRPHDHGNERLFRPSNTASVLMKAFSKIYERITEPNTEGVRRISLMGDTQSENKITEQIDLFDELSEEDRKQTERVKKDEKLQRALLKITDKYGKNTILRGMDLQQGATTIERNDQIGGHQA